MAVYVFTLPVETVEEVTVTQRLLLRLRSPNVVSGSWTDFSITVVLLRLSAPFKKAAQFQITKKKKRYSCFYD
jgi:hypothetical protein